MGKYRSEWRVLPAGAAIAAFVTIVGIAGAGRCENVVSVPTRDRAMMAAYAKAAAGFEDFLAAWRNPPSEATDFAVKVGLTDSNEEPGFAVIRPGSRHRGNIEYVWLENLKENGDGFTGQPVSIEHLENIRLNDTVHFTKADIADWMYYLDGKVVGNATACAALKHGSWSTRRAVKKMGIDCNK